MKREPSVKTRPIRDYGVAAVLGFLILAFTVQLWNRNRPPRLVPAPLTLSQQADAIAGRLSRKAADYHNQHGKFPDTATFFEQVGETPPVNPLNGRAANGFDLRRSEQDEYGWVAVRRSNRRGVCGSANPEVIPQRDFSLAASVQNSIGWNIPFS